MNVHPLTKIIGHAALAVVAAGLIATHACAQTSPAPWRIEVLAVPSKTLTSTQFLSGIPGRDVVLSWPPK